MIACIVATQSIEEVIINKYMDLTTEWAFIDYC